MSDDYPQRLAEQRPCANCARPVFPRRDARGVKHVYAKDTKKCKVPA